MTTPIELSIRADLLDLIDHAVERGTDQERLDLLATAAIRIRALNSEHDAVCVDRGDAEKRVDQLAAALDSAGLAVPAPSNELAPVAP